MATDYDGTANYAAITLDQSDDALKIFNNNSIRSDLVIKNDGNVGIGTTAPAYALDVRSSGATTLQVRSAANADDTMLKLQCNDYYFNITNQGAGGNVTYASDDGQDQIWYTDNASNATTERFRIEGGATTDSAYFSNCNVGIGTDAPSVPLHVYGTSANVKLSVQNSGGVTWSLNSTSGNTLNIDDAAYNKFRILSGAGGAIVLHPDGTGETYILGGSVAIGHSNPSYKLDVSGTFRTTGQAYLNGGLRLGGANSNFAGERLFNIPSFTNGVANQKIDLYWTGAFWGYMEIEITGSYSNQNMAGVLTKSFALGLNASNAIYTNESWYSNVGGVTNNNFAISGVTWDSTNSRYRIQIVHRTSTGNAVTLRLRCLGASAAHADVFMSGTTVGSIYTTDTTAFALPVVQLAAPNDNAWVDGYLGIGTATPAARLHVHNTSSGYTWLKIGNATRADGMLIGCDSNELQQIYVNGANPLTFWTNDTEKMRIQSDGNVGIGTTAPGHKLHVKGSNDYVLKVEQTAATWSALIQNTNATGYGLSIDCSNDTGSAVYALAVYTGINSGVFVTNQARLGVGTTTPSQSLDVYGHVTVDSGGIIIEDIGEQLQFQDGNCYIDRNSNDIVFHGYNGHIFTRNGAESMRINGNGSVGIGRTAPSTKLVIQGVYDASATPSAIYGNASNKGIEIICEKNGSWPTGYTYGIDFAAKDAIDGTDHYQVAAIYGAVESVPYQVAGQLKFYTTGGGNNATLEERMTILADGNVVVGGEEQATTKDV